MVLRTDYIAGDPNHPDVHNAVDAAINAVQAQATATDASLATTNSTLSALSATVAGVSTNISGLTQLPTWAGARGKPYDPKTSIYNQTATSTLLMRSALSQARQGARVPILCVGNDAVAGAGATPGVNDYPIQLRQHLAAKGFPIGGTGFVFMNNNTTVDARLNIDGSWSQGSRTSYHWVQATTTGATIVFTPDVAGTALEIITTSNSGPFTYKIGVSNPVTVTPPGGSTMMLLTVGGQSIPIGTTITIKTTSTTNVKIVAVNVRSETGGIEVSNAGVSGTAVTDWQSGNLGAFNNLYNSTYPLIAPKISLITLDSTEALAAGSVSTYKTNYNVLIGQFGWTAHGVGIITSPNITPGGFGFPTITQTNWNTFLSAEYDLSDLFNVPLADMTDRLSTHTLATNAAMTADAIHLNGSGYSEMADAALSITSGGTGNLPPEPLGLSAGTLAALNALFDTPAEVAAAIAAATGPSVLSF
jgi:lysophospholipase L1-like esterase